MASAAVQAGVGTIATTPHFRPDFPDVHEDELAARCRQLRSELEQAEIPLAVLSGGEVSLAWALDADDEQLRLVSYAQRGTDLLIETPTGHAVGLDRFLYQLAAKGYRVTLGHPERNPQFQRDPDSLQALAEQGVLLQVNAESLVGHGEGRAARRLARELLLTGLAHVIASDAHRAGGWRPVTRLAEAVAVATELIGLERARWMAETAPRAIVEGSELPAAPPVSRPRRRPRLFGH
jgi:protein-tyrosine phosphatase